MVYLTAYFGMPMELGMFSSVFLALFFNSPAGRKGTLWSSFLAIRLMSIQKSGEEGENEDRGYRGLLHQ